MTRQRAAVYDYLLSTDSHPTAEAIHKFVQEEIPRISLATVYNAVDSLVDVGLARKIQRGVSSARYDGAVEDHAHFRCFACDGVWDVAMDAMPQAAPTLHAFEVVHVNVEFVGYCPECRREKLGLSPLPDGQSETTCQDREAASP